MPIDPSNITPFNGRNGFYTGNATDSNGNEITSGSKFSFSTNAAVAHLYATAVGLTALIPNFVDSTVTGTATATAYNTFTATQVTTAETTPAATTAFARLV